MTSAKLLAKIYTADLVAAASSIALPSSGCLLTALFHSTSGHVLQHALVHEDQCGSYDLRSAMLFRHRRNVAEACAAEGSRWVSDITI